MTQTDSHRKWTLVELELGVKEGTAQKATGTVKWFDRKKGLGYITILPEQPDVFVHHTAIVDDASGKRHTNLFEGDEVMLYVIQTEKGPQAQHVIVTKAGDRPTKRISKPHHRQKRAFWPSF